MTKQIIAAVVVVIALAAAFVLFTEPEPVRETVTSWRMPEIEQLDRVTLNRGDLELVIDKGVDRWNIQQPLSFPADNRQMESVEGLFADDDNRLVADEQKEASPNNLSRYGFDAGDTLRVTLYDSGEAATTFVVGAVEETPSGDPRTWVRPEDSDMLYRLNRDLRQVLDRDLDEWRNDEVLALEREERDALDAVDIAYDEQAIRLEKTTDDEGETLWQMVEPADIEVDPDLIARWVRQINRLTADGFADDVSAEEASLDNPLHIVTLHIGEETSYRLEFGTTIASTAEERAEQRYVRLGDGPIYTVTERSAERLLKRTGDFRPRRVLELDRDAVRSIAITDRDGSEMVLVRNDLPEDAEEGDEATWRMEQPERIDPVDMTEFRRMLTNTVEVDAQTFDDGITAAQAALDEPRRTLTLTLDDDSQYVIAIGRPVDGDEVDDGETDHFARVGDGLIFVLQDFKVRNLLKGLEDLRPESEEE